MQFTQSDMDYAINDNLHMHGGRLFTSHVQELFTKYVVSESVKGEGIIHVEQGERDFWMMVNPVDGEMLKVSEAFRGSDVHGMEERRLIQSIAVAFYRAMEDVQS